MITKIYNSSHVFECYIVQNRGGYEIVLPPTETLKSIHVSSLIEAYNWLDRQFGCDGWYK